MASIRNRSPWRVSVEGHSELEAQGYPQVRLTQDRDGAWKARVRRQGGPWFEDECLKPEAKGSAEHHRVRRLQRESAEYEYA